MIASRSFLREAKVSLLLGKTLCEDRLVSDEPASQPDNLFHVVKHEKCREQPDVGIYCHDQSVISVPDNP